MEERSIFFSKFNRQDSAAQKGKPRLDKMPYTQDIRGGEELRRPSKVGRHSRKRMRLISHNIKSMQTFSKS